MLVTPWYDKISQSNASKQQRVLKLLGLAVICTANKWLSLTILSQSERIEAHLSGQSEAKPFIMTIGGSIYSLTIYLSYLYFLLDELRRTIIQQNKTSEIAVELRFLKLPALKL